MSAKQYSSIGLGGTFDHFHIGHIHFVRFAAKLADQLQIGLATSRLTEKKILPKSIQSFADRHQALSYFLEQEDIKANIFELDDLYGPTLQPNAVEALAVTKMTESGGEAINQARQKLQLSTLPLHVCDLVKDETGEFISSTRIRQGQITRQGQVFLKNLLNATTLSEKQKAQLKKKQGQLVQKPASGSLFQFVIGDIVLETFIQNNWPYTLGIFDGQTQRQTYNSKTLQSLNIHKKIENPAGQIVSELSTYLANFSISLSHSKSKQTQHIFITGEEDLAAVSAVLLAPLGSAVYYGQPGEGIVEVLVTEEIKAKFLALLQTS